MDAILKEMRKTMLRASALGKDGNLQSSFSSLEILWTLYDHFLPLSQSELEDKDRNRFVLSKGQSNFALMVVLAEKGLVDKKELNSFCKFDSRISMQADRTKFGSFIETSAGSLGHGFPMAVGMAWAKKIRGEKGLIFCLAGDGEMNEGTMWEAAIFAASEGLDNLVLIVDNNHSIGRMINMGDLKKKFEAFGFSVDEVNGHDTFELISVFNKVHTSPHVILANTVRGYGSKTLMEDRSWFHRYPKGEELEQLIEEVDSL